MEIVKEITLLSTLLSILFVGLHKLTQKVDE